MQTKKRATLKASKSKAVKKIVKKAHSSHRATKGTAPKKVAKKAVAVRGSVKNKVVAKKTFSSSKKAVKKRPKKKVKYNLVICVECKINGAKKNKQHCTPCLIKLGMKEPPYRKSERKTRRRTRSKRNLENIYARMQAIPKARKR